MNDWQPTLLPYLSIGFALFSIMLLVILVGGCGG